MIGYQSCPGCWYSGAAHLDGCEEYAKELDELAKQLRPAKHPVAPAPTASAREPMTALEIVDVIAGQCAKFINARRDIPLSNLAHIVEEYAENRGKYVASSQSSKLEGVGQEAADLLAKEVVRMLREEKRSGYNTAKSFATKIAAIIDELIAGRLKP